MYSKRVAVRSIKMTSVLFRSQKQNPPSLGINTNRSFKSVEMLVFQSYFFNKPLDSITIRLDLL